MKKFIFAVLLCTSLVGYSATFKKITELSTTSMTNIATGDLMVVVDSSSGPTTFAITFDELDKRFYNNNYTSTATFNTKVVVEDAHSLVVEATAFVMGKLLLKSPDNTCAACGIDNGDTFTCTSTPCL